MKNLLGSTFLLIFCGIGIASATNITCSTTDSVDRITVLRGQAEIMLRESRERTTVAEGEELVVKRGGKTEKTEIDVASEQRKWQTEIAALGNSVGLDEIVDTLRQLQQSQGESFAGIQESFKTLLAQSAVEESVDQEFKKNVERFITTQREDQIILAALRARVDAALADGTTSPAQRTQLVGYQKMIADVGRGIQGYQAESAKMIKATFRMASPTTTAGETEQLVAELGEISANLGAVASELSADPSGHSQDWFADAVELTNEELNRLGELAVTVQAALDKDPENAQLLALVKQIANKQNFASWMLRSFRVSPVDVAVLIQAQEIEDQMSDQMVRLEAQFEALSRLDEISNRDIEAIFQDYDGLQELYVNMQRLYDNVMRATSGQRYLTSEQEEVMALWERVSDLYQTIAPFADMLASGSIVINGRSYSRPGMAETPAPTAPEEITHSNDVIPPPGFTELGAYSYLSWGAWESPVAELNPVISTDTHWISGSLTPGVDIPAMGSASYIGEVHGSLNEGGVVSSVTGTASLLAFFENRGLTGRFDNMMRNDSTLWTGATLNARWDAGVNQIAGTLDADNGMTGSVNGNFFGPAANQVGGGWTLQSGDAVDSASGIFVGNSDIPGPATN